jgi:hypothetical protein
VPNKIKYIHSFTYLFFLCSSTRITLLCTELIIFILT